MRSNFSSALRRLLKPAIDALRDLRTNVLLLANPIGKALRHEAIAHRPRILFIDEMLPDPRFGAGYPRAAELLRAIVAERWDATVYPLSASASDYASVSAQFPAGVRWLPSYGRLGLRQLLEAGADRFDVVLVSRASTMTVFAAACASAPRFLASTYCIYDAEAIFTLREAQRLAIFGGNDTSSKLDEMLAQEISLVADAHAVIAVSEAEAEVFRQRTSASVYVVSHGVEIRKQIKPLDGRENLLIVGRFTGLRDQSPNVDSLVWFVDEVMPHLDTLIGANYRLVVVGFAPDELVARLASQRVVFKGVVDDLASVYDACRVFIAPTRFAGGIPLKVIEAAAAGIPCVVTKILATQLGMVDGKQVMTADEPRRFAAACARLYEDSKAWNAVRDEVLRSVTTNYGTEAFAASVRAMLTDVQKSAVCVNRPDAGV